MARLRGVVEPHLGQQKRLVDLRDGTCLRLLPASGVNLVPSSAAGETARDDVFLDAVDSRAHEPTFLSEICGTLDRIPHGATAVILARDPWSNIPVEAVQAAAANRGSQLLEIAQLSYSDWAAALIIGGRPAHPGPDAVTPTETPVTLRLGPRLAPADSTAALLPVDPFLGAAEKAARELRRGCQSRTRTIERLENRIEELRTSVRMQLGTVVVDLARNPLAVRRVLKAFKRASVQRAALRKRSTAAAGAGSGITFDALHQVDSSIRGTTGFDFVSRNEHFTILGILKDPAATTLADCARLYRPLPHDAAVDLARAAPDLLLIQAGALLPPSGWAHAATPGGAVSAAKALDELVRLAQRREVPVVVWQDVSPTYVPGLDSLTDLADLVVPRDLPLIGGLRWSPGVSLRQAGPAPKTVSDRLLVIDEGLGDPSQFSGARIGSELERSGLATVLRSEQPDLFEEIRRHRLLAAVPFDRRYGTGVTDLALAALASGSRVLCAAADDLAGAFGASVVAVADPGSAVATASEVLTWPEPALPETHSILRQIFDHHASPARLALLVKRLGLSGNPLASRAVTALVKAADADELGPKLDSLLHQSTLPSKLVLVSPNANDRCLDEAAALGIRTQVISGDGAIPVPITALDTPWLIIWNTPDARVHRHWIKDLLAASECTGAEAVGFVERSDGYCGYGDYVPELSPDRALIRSELFARLQQAGDVSQLRGAPLFALSLAGASR